MTQFKDQRMHNEIVGYCWYGTGTGLYECATLNFANKNGGYNIYINRIIRYYTKFVVFMYGMF